MIDNNVILNHNAHKIQYARIELRKPIYYSNEAYLGKKIKAYILIIKT